MLAMATVATKTAATATEAAVPVATAVQFELVQCAFWPTASTHCVLPALHYHKMTTTRPDYLVATTPRPISSPPLCTSIPSILCAQQQQHVEQPCRAHPAADVCDVGESSRAWQSAPTLTKGEGSLAHGKVCRRQPFLK